jgi:tRNA G18 (ribose-2'-O)-methylase SpoU
MLPRLPLPSANMLPRLPLPSAARLAAPPAARPAAAALHLTALPPRRLASSFDSGGSGGGPPTKEFVHGVHPCAAALLFSPTGLPAAAAARLRGREIKRVYVARSEAASEPGLGALLEEVARRGLRTVHTDRQHLNNMVHQQVAQGIVFEVTPVRTRRLEAPPSPPPAPVVDGSHPPPLPPLLVALDELQDVHNVGAIARSAFLLCADGLVTGVRGSAPFNGTVSKTSSGALEHLAGRGQLYVTQSLPAFLAACRDAGWRVLGASAPPARLRGRGGATAGAAATTAAAGDAAAPEPAASLAPAAVATADADAPAPRAPPVWVSSHDLRRDAPTVLVLGSEGKGLRTNVKRECTGFAYIPMAPRQLHQPVEASGEGPAAPGRPAGPGSSALSGFGAVESLNVAAAAAVLLHALSRPATT